MDGVIVKCGQRYVWECVATRGAVSEYVVGSMWLPDMWMVELSNEYAVGIGVTVMT